MARKKSRASKKRAQERQAAARKARILWTAGLVSVAGIAVAISFVADPRNDKVTKFPGVKKEEIVAGSGKPSPKPEPRLPGPGESYASEFREWAQNEFTRIIESHPAQEISGHLRQLFHERKVTVTFSTTPGEGHAWGSVITRQGRLILVVYPQVFFSDENTEAERQIGILHEYIHIRQAMGDPYQAKLMDPDRPIQGIKEVEAHYEAEIEAYLAQCEFAIHHGLAERSRDRLCLFYRDKGGEARLRLILAKGLPHRMPRIYGGYESELLKWAKDKTRYKSRQ